jgi:hypothetical protein
LYIGWSGKNFGLDVYHCSGVERFLAEPLDRAESQQEGKTMVWAMSPFNQLLQHFPSLEFAARAKKHKAERGARASAADTAG